MHVRARGLALQRLDEAGKTIPVELVVAEHIDNRDLDPLIENPSHPPVPDMRIARQNDEIGADVRDDEIPELDVQIR